MTYLSDLHDFYGIPGGAVIGITVGASAVIIIALVTALKLHCYFWKRKIHEAELLRKVELAERRVREQTSHSTSAKTGIEKKDDLGTSPAPKIKTPINLHTPVHSTPTTTTPLHRAVAIREITDLHGPALAKVTSSKTLNPIFAHGSRDWSFFYEAAPKFKRYFDWKSLPTTLKLPTHMWSILPYKTDRPIELRCSKYDNDDVNSTVFVSVRPLVRECFRPFLKFGMRLSEPFDYRTLPTSVLNQTLNSKILAVREPYYILKVFIFRTETPCFEIHYQGKTPHFLHKIPRCPECKNLDNVTPMPWVDVLKLSQSLRNMPSGHHFHGKIVVPPRLSRENEGEQVVNIFAYHGAPACIAVEPSENPDYHVNRQNVAFKRSELHFRGTKNVAGFSSSTSSKRTPEEVDTASTKSTKSTLSAKMV
uniref:DUF667 domain-containing protein n=1 Tax=Panagrellus redivivus TaxID=6233 RepID=A0A7E4VFB6_PANRE